MVKYMQTVLIEIIPMKKKVTKICLGTNISADFLLLPTFFYDIIYAKAAYKGPVFF